MSRVFSSINKLINPIKAEKFKKELADLKAENLSLVAQKKAADAQKIFEEYKSKFWDFLKTNPIRATRIYQSINCSGQLTSINSQAFFSLIHYLQTYCQYPSLAHFQQDIYLVSPLSQHSSFKGQSLTLHSISCRS